MRFSQWLYGTARSSHAPQRNSTYCGHDRTDFRNRHGLSGLDNIVTGRVKPLVSRRLHGSRAESESLALGSRVSVVIPNYNHTRFLRNAIRSVLDQTHHAFEIIVTDDGSTDNCREVVAAFADQVRYIWQDNRGLAEARNTGIRAAEGEWIALLDADDEWRPRFLERMVTLAQESGASVAYCSAQAVDESGRELPQRFGGAVLRPERIRHTLLRANFIIPSTTLLRRSAIDEVGLFDQSLRSCEDWDLWLRLLPKHMIVGTSECLVRYRLHGSSLSRNVLGMQQAVQAVVQKHFGPDDGQYSIWPSDKRRAYGGVFRYHALTSIQGHQNWLTGARYLKRAIQTDPTLAADLDLFYDLALGDQPFGYRGSLLQLDLLRNATQTRSMLESVFRCPPLPRKDGLRRRAFGTAEAAIGLVAYNTGQLALSRRCLFVGLLYRPDLVKDGRIVGGLIKSILGRRLSDWLKKWSLAIKSSCCTHSTQ
ncbi:MAG: glycosyltransferase family 2 protein [Acidobacteriota bacterium]